MPKGSKVLMADDDKMLLDMYKERLELAGYAVQSFYNGEDALAHVHDFGPDIVMLDVMMPKMNGYETLASLKSDPTTKDIPVVMLSALMRDFNREKAMEGGAEDYLIKSEAMPSDVITKIEQVLQKFGKGSAPVPGTNPPADSPQAPVAPEAPLVTPPEASAQVPSDQPVQPAPMENTAQSMGDSALAGKVFTTPSSDMQSLDLSQATADGSDMAQESSKDSATDGKLVFEPSSDQAAPQSPQTSSDDGVAKVTEINPPPAAPVNDKNTPTTPLSEDDKTEEVIKSNWIVPLVVILIAVLVVIGAIAFYLTYMR